MELHALSGFVAIALFEVWPKTAYESDVIAAIEVIYVASFLGS